MKFKKTLLSLNYNRWISIITQTKFHFSQNMYHISTEGFGDTSVLKIKNSPLPKVSPNEALIKVKATAINRADILQRQGKYPPPKGVTDILGLEAAGYVVSEDGKIDESKPVMCLLGGGGYAQYAKVNKKHIMPIPQHISVEDAAAIPEAWLTAFLNLRMIGFLNKNHNVMVYAGASGVGTAAIQLIRYFEANAYFTCSTQDKIDFCIKLGAKQGFNYKTLKNNEIFGNYIKLNNGKLIDIIFDCVGPQNFELSAKLANLDSKWILYGLLSGAKLENFNLATIVGKRVSLIGSTIRSRTDDYKTSIIETFKKEVYRGFTEKQLKPVIDKKLKLSWDEKGLSSLKDGHMYIEANKNIGKMVLVLD